jgi:hypothetical protein
MARFQQLNLILLQPLAPCYQHGPGGEIIPYYATRMGCRDKDNDDRPYCLNQDRIKHDRATGVSPGVPTVSPTTISQESPTGGDAERACRSVSELELSPINRDQDIFGEYLV